MVQYHGNLSPVFHPLSRRRKAGNPLPPEVWKRPDIFVFAVSALHPLSSEAGQIVRQAAPSDSTRTSNGVTNLLNYAHTILVALEVFETPFKQHESVHS
ncbi:hypothetical protein PanWU01x14_177050 [Parasponia andersonii]|uniref:Uncharacterized protein n=1 Tax=Parasponia andersonii TaxID=3476 RepID=A0A2P5C7K3_PARAD|nr:hypothetical protein PanWU01x14_177050 [Parasponia andersonii]